MLVHTTGQSLGQDVSFGAHLLEGFTIIGVNVFVLITGYFSTTPKKSNFINIAFICLFWMIIKVACLYSFDEDISYKYAFFITRSNWFIPAYLTLLLLSPILNLFAESVDKKALIGLVALLLLSEIWFDLLPPNPDIKLGSNRGYSVLSFIILYLLARAIRLYGLPRWFKKYSPYIYIICSLVLGVLAHSLLSAGKIGAINKYCFAYNNPIVILSAVAFFIMFEKLHFQSRILNYFAKSTLAILLGHTAISFLYKKQFLYLYNHYSGVEVVVYWAVSIIIVFCGCIIIDQIRLLLYRPIERLMKSKIKNNYILYRPQTNTDNKNNK